MIGSKAEDPQRLADFIDWLYSPEGIMVSCAQTSSTCGPEGLTWEMKDGKPVLTEFGKKALSGEEIEVPEEDSQITTLRGQIKAVIVENSWKMVFAKDEAEFNQYLKTMQDTANGLGFDQVLEYDMQCAKDQNDARVQVVKDYEANK